MRCAPTAGIDDVRSALVGALRLRHARRRSIPAAGPAPLHLGGVLGAARTRRGSRLAFVPVARLDQLSDSRGLRVKIGEIAFALYRVGDAIHAMEDACPHAGYPLSKGRFEAGVIQCAAHGLRYDVRTGFDPSLADGFPIPCFRVRVAGDTVEVDLEDRINEPPRRRPPGPRAP